MRGFARVFPRFASARASRATGIAMCVTCAVGATLASAGAASLAVPPGVPIPVVLVVALTSATARVGDSFAFKTARDEKLGTVVVPAGSIGHGRLAVVTPAGERTDGSLALQADSLDLPGGDTIAVDVDPGRPPRGHLSERSTHVSLIPIVIGVVPVVKTRVRGDLVLDPGTAFTIVTTRPRPFPAPLVTATPGRALPGPVPSPT